VFNDIKWMCIDKPGRLMIDSRRAIVHLDVDWSSVVVRIVLVPPDQHTSGWLDPVEPVVLVWIIGSQLKPNLDPSSCRRVLVVAKELSRVHVADHTVWASFARLGTPSANIVEISSESILDAVVEPLALQVGPVSEKHDH
jgi:hypothetical protein